MVIRTGLSQFQSSISQGFLSVNLPNTSTSQIGKVFGVVLNENTPSREQFERVGGWSGIGAILYLDYEASKTQGDNIDLNKCNIALPLDPNLKNYPLVGETVLLTDGPSFQSQFSSAAGRKYYIGTINVWNNPQQNAPFSTTLGKTFIENADIRPLLPFEGDYIIQGRKGAGIRFGSTVPLYSTVSEWSRNGRPSGDPITILVNGYITTDTGSLTPNIEEINKEMSSIYMTSTQTIPLIPGATIINPINSSLEPRQYVDSQVILNSDRVTLNSKKDEVLIFAKTNIEISANNVINLNTNDYIHLNIESKNPDSKILLGTKIDNTVPDEPVLLGNQTVILLEQLITALNALGGYLSSAVVPTTNGGIPITAVNNAGVQLLNDTSRICDQLLKITSNKVYTV